MDRLERLALEMTHGAPPAPPGLHPLDAAALGTTPIPVVGDILGAAADVRRFVQEPESRTPLNYGLAALGLLPFVPPALAGAHKALETANKGTALSRLARARPREQGILGGPRAKTSDLQALSRAIEMADKGVTGEEIWKQTGWWVKAPGSPPPPGGIPRFEIDDSAMDFTDASASMPNEAATYPMRHTMQRTGQATPPLAETFSHPELFQAYPELAQARSQPFSSQQVLGAFDYENAPEGMLYLNELLERPDALGTTVHELQHAVQELEGMPRGGNLELARKIMKQKAPTPGNKPGVPLTPEQIYHRLTGEVEARAVDARRTMSPEMRSMVPPWLSYDVHPSEMISLRRGPRKTSPR